MAATRPTFKLRFYDGYFLWEKEELKGEGVKTIYIKPTTIRTSNEELSFKEAMAKHKIKWRKGDLLFRPHMIRKVVENILPCKKMPDECKKLFGILSELHSVFLFRAIEDDSETTIRRKYRNYHDGKCVLTSEDKSWLDSMNLLSFTPQRKEFYERMIRDGNDLFAQNKRWFDSLEYDREFGENYKVVKPK